MTIYTFQYILNTSAESKTLIAVDELLASGGTVIGYTVYTHDDDVWERWAIRKDETKAATPLLQNVQVRAITSFECRETYSKSRNQHFKFWTCELDNGEKVNIFDHPDESRNTFKIMKAAGWETLEQMIVGETYEPNPPIAVTVSHDGEWYSLTGIIKNEHYVTAFTYYPDANLQPDMPPDDIPFGSDDNV
jgi:hypothetical protein